MRVLARLRALHAEGIPALSRHDVLARLTGLTELTLDSVATPKTLTVLPLLRSLTLRRLLVEEGLQALHVGGRAVHASQPRMHAACCMPGPADESHGKRRVRVRNTPPPPSCCMAMDCVHARIRCGDAAHRC